MRSILVAGLLAFLLPLAPVAARGDSPRSALQAGNRLYAEGKYEQALAAYREGLLKYPDVPELHYGAGNVLYRLKRFPEAAGEYDEAARAQSELTRGESRYNQGDAQVRQNQLNEALDSYREALRHDPEDRDSKFNYELIKARLEQKKNPNQNQNQSKQQQQQRQPPKQPSAGGNRPKPEQENPQDRGAAGRSMRDPQQLNREQADQILKALASDEARLQKERLKARVTNRRPEKDW